jgi:LysM repeat protein
MRRCLACLALLMTLTACGQKIEATATPVTAKPTQATTLTKTPTQTPTVIPGVTEIVLPTPTVITYIVVLGDTLSSIAARYGVTPEALQAANPGVSPTVLTVGTKLVIPTGDQVPADAAPTPATLPVRQAHCWPEASGGLWCFGLVQNEYAETLENISAQFTLLDAGGQELTSQVVYGLLDILPPGAAMPLAAHFVPPVQADARVRVQVLTAIRLLPGDTRYLPVRLENSLVSVEASGKMAAVSGRILLTGEGTAEPVWVLASAYAADGVVVGLRRWEASVGLTADAPVPFDFQVYSVGPAIARVEFLVEARP